MPTERVLKPAAERLAETITILKKLQEIGIGDSDPGYVRVKELMSAWVKSEATVGQDHHIDFPRHRRRGDLVLPVRPGRPASLNLRAI